MGAYVKSKGAFVPYAKFATRVFAAADNDVKSVTMIRVGSEGIRVPRTTGETPGGDSAPLLRVISADLRGMARLKGVRYPSAHGLVDLLSLPGVWATIMFRIADRLHRRGLRPLSRIVFFINFVLFNTELFPGADIGPGLVVPHPGGIGIAKGCVIGRDFHVMAGVRIGGGAADDSDRDGFPRFGDGCYMLDGAKAFGPITVGDATLVAASSVVLSDLPAGVVAAGIPAHAIKPRPGHRPERPSIPPC